MENASKALIIAGAILLSILIISLGIMVYNNAKNTVGSSNLDKQEIQTFNSQWEQYEGSNKTASEVKTMIQAVIANNASEAKNGKSRFVEVEVNADAKENTEVDSNPNIKMSDATNGLTNSKTYTITLGYYNGLINSIGWK